MLEEIVHSFEEEIKGKVGYLSSSGTDQIDAKIYAKLRCRRKRTFLSTHVVDKKAAFPQRIFYDFLEIEGLHHVTVFP